MSQHPDWQDDGGKSCTSPLSFPKPIYNRPGLSRIDFRIGEFADFREWVFRKLNTDPVLRGWTHREPDDPGIALLEGAAVLGDILTFYQSLYANEAYLRTAQWRESVMDLVRLLGYYPAPGVGGTAIFAFAVDGNDPVDVPAGFPLKAQVEGLEKPAEFETLAKSRAYPSLSEFYLYQPNAPEQISSGTNSFSLLTASLKNLAVELKEGDSLLLTVNPANSTGIQQIVIVKKIEEFFDRTEITIEGDWQGGDSNQVYAYRLGRTFRHYGYNGPAKEITVTYPDGKAVDFVRQINPGANSEASKDIEGTPTLSAKSFPLDSEVDDLSVGGIFLVKLHLQTADDAISSAAHFFERALKSVSQGACRIGVLSGGTTIVELNNAVSTGNWKYANLRSVELLEVLGDRFILEGVYAPSVASGLTSLSHFGTLKEYKQLHNRPLLFAKGDTSYARIVPKIDETLGGTDDLDEFRLLTISGFKAADGFALNDFDLRDKPAVTIYGNLVDADQGKTEKEAVLGNGDSRQIFQTFKLPKAPLTYHTKAGAAPPEVPELKIYVEGRLWQRVSAFFDCKADQEIYIVREDSEGESWVQFGDGKTGRRLPSGVKNVVAKYRSGIGAYGALKKDTTVQAGSRLKRLDKVFMPTVSSGGVGPEAGDTAREAAPGRIQSLSRLVSLKDFENETLAISGVTKALARWGLNDGIPMVILTVLMKSGREGEISTVRKTLEKYNRCRGANRFPIKVLGGQLLYVYLSARVTCNPSYRQELVYKEIGKALGLSEAKGLFSLKNRRFGENEYSTRIEGAIQDVDGVLWNQVTGLFPLNASLSGGTLSQSHSGSIKPADLVVPSEKPLMEVVHCDERHILGLYQAHLALTMVQNAAGEGC